MYYLQKSFISGKWTVSSICKSLELVRRGVLSPNGAFYFQDLFSDGSHTMFVAGNIFNIEKEVNYIHREDIWGSATPLRFRSCVTHVGKSSLSINQYMYDHKTGRKLMSSITKLVYVDRKTRKSSQLPDWYTTKIRIFLTENKIPNQSIEKSVAVSVPNDCFSYEVKALQSDCDRNFHVNQCVYLRWCSDVGALAAELGMYKYFMKDIGVYELKNIHVQYFGEALMDEKILVFTWEDLDDARTLHFIMKNKGGHIFQATLKYFEEQSNDNMNISPVSVL